MYMSYREYKIKRAWLEKLADNGDQWCVLVMKLDGVRITIIRMNKPNLEHPDQDRFVMSSKDRFSYRASKKHCEWVEQDNTWVLDQGWTLRSLTADQVMKILSKYNGICY